MMDDLDVIRRILEAHQFTYHLRPNPFTTVLEGMVKDLEGSPEFYRTVNPTWKIRADQSFDKEYLCMGLEHSIHEPLIGTEHRFYSLSGLQQHVANAVTRMEHFANNDHLLKCPDCKTRWVHPKESRYGWFLSCTGADMLHRFSREGMRVKDFACRGVQKNMQVIALYR